MDLDGIAVFVKVVQAGSFRQAARLLGMPNSTVSAKVSLLEKRLGVTLIQRTTRKLRVTQPGEAYFRRCVQALEEIQAAETEVATSQQEPQGLLRITTAVDVGHSLLPPLVRAFLKQYPRMEVELMVTNRMVDLVAEGVDLGIRGGKLEDSSLIATRFVIGHGVLWASPSYLKKNGAPSHPEELSRHECLRFSPFKDNAWELTDGKQTAIVAARGRVLADDLETIKMFALLGQGIGLVPAFLCDEEARKGKLVQVLPQWHGAFGSFSLVYPAQRFVSPKIRAFISLAEETLKGRTF